MSTDMTAEDLIKLNQSIKEILDKEDLITATVKKEKFMQELKKLYFGEGEETK